MATLAILSAGSLMLTAILTGLVRRHAFAQGLLDEVNARSSHTVPTPRGGGLAIIAAFLLFWSIGAFQFSVEAGDVIGIIGASVAVSLVGWVDDQNHVSAKWRLAVHFACGAWLLTWLGLPAIPVLDNLPSPAWWMVGTITVILTAWSINLSNFMDGIDGIAASQAAFIGLAAAALGIGTGAETIQTMTGLLLASASIGFLFWNWPPAKIFMGDASSGFLGLIVAVLVLIGARDGEASLAAMLILPALFVADASTTLLRRLMRRAQLSSAHRSHVYQRLSRKAERHLPVTLGYLATNVGLVFPLAWLSATGIVQPLIGLGMAYLPLLTLGWMLGAGKEDGK